MDIPTTSIPVERVISDEKNQTDSTNNTKTLVADVAKDPTVPDSLTQPPIAFKEMWQQVAEINKALEDFVDQMITGEHFKKLKVAGTASNDADKNADKPGSSSS